jgi:hypothetical protein
MLQKQLNLYQTLGGQFQPESGGQFEPETWGSVSPGFRGSICVDFPVNQTLVLRINICSENRYLHQALNR